MENQDAVSPDVRLPGQEPVDLEPSIEPEPDQDPAAASSAAEEQGEASESADPELGNTLINPESS